MTIIEPNRAHRTIGALFVVSLTMLAVVAAWSIFVYNTTVDLRHTIAAKEREHDESLSENADLKNAFYALVDQKSLRAAALRGGLVPSAQVEYVEFGDAPLAVAP